MHRADRKNTKILKKRGMFSLNFRKMSRRNHPLFIRTRLFVLFKQHFRFRYLYSVTAEQRKHLVSVGCFGHLISDINVSRDIANGSYFLLGNH